MPERTTRTVLGANLRSARLEFGSRRFPRTDRAAVVASYGADHAVSRSLLEMVAEFERLGYRTIVVRASESTAALDWPVGAPRPTALVRKPNIGYDFGSWAVGLELFPAVRSKPFVVLANDSLVGPFSGMADLVEDFERTTADVWAATSTRQIVDHLQSYFVGFRNGVLNEPPLRQFYRHLPDVQDKSEIIERYEMGLSRLLFAEGYTTSAAFESEQVVAAVHNPTIEGWRELLRLGFPFVKRELITNPDVVADGREVRDEVRRRFDTDPEGWL